MRSYRFIGDNRGHVRCLESSETVLALVITAERERRRLIKRAKRCIIIQAAEALFCFLNETFSTPTVSTPLGSVFN